MSADSVSITVDIPRFKIRKGIVYSPGKGRGIQERAAWIVTDRLLGSSERFTEHATALTWVRMQLRWERALR